MDKSEIAELIVRRRRQILIHSCIYYKYGKGVITDHQFDKWSRELLQLMNNNPEFINKLEWWMDFEDFTATGGSHLPSMENDWVERKANQLMEYAEKHKLLL